MGTSDEIIRLRTLKPSFSERREATNIPPPAPMDPDAVPPETGGFPSLVTSASVEEDAASENVTPTTESNDTPDGDTSTNDTKADDSQPQQDTATSTDSANSSPPSSGAEGETKVEREAREDAAGVNAAKEKADDDSDEAVGKEEAAELDRDMMDDADSAKDSNDEGQESGESEDASNNSKVTSMFQKFLSLGTNQSLSVGTNQSGQIVVKVGDAASAAGGGGE